MSTRSMIGPGDRGDRKGKYCHNDGYSSWNGVQLVKLIQRDGIEKVKKTLFEDNPYGWSSIDSDEKIEKFEKGKETGYYNNRFSCTPGYGIAYTKEDGDDYWSDICSEEWGYILNDDGTIDVYAYNKHLGKIDTNDGNAVEDMKKLEQKVY